MTLQDLDVFKPLIYNVTLFNDVPLLITPHEKYQSKRRDGVM